MLRDVVISGTGLYVPPNRVSNKELVEAFNANAAKTPGKPLSDAAFIEKASGITNRHFIASEGILDPNRLMPIFERRDDSACSMQAEFGLNSIRGALEAAGLSPSDLDGLIVSSTNLQRPYPGIAVEIMNQLGIAGKYAQDMQAACSSATFGMNAAYQMIRAGMLDTCLVVCPEICSTQVDFSDRDSHFIFGDASVAIVLQAKSVSKRPQFEIQSTKLATQFSNNIRCNLGFLNKVCGQGDLEPYFTQEGRKVFKEVIPFVVNHIKSHLEQQQMCGSDISRFWLHQANSNINQLIVKKLLDHVPDTDRAPLVLSEYGNTAAAGSVIALHLHPDVPKGSLGLLCSFGAGYSVGSLLLKRC